MSEKRRAPVENLESALGRLLAALARPKDEFLRDSSIQRFEFTFELFWKTLKALGDDAGVTSFSPRDAFRTGFRLGVITDDAAWFAMLEDRNQTSHTYNVALAEAIYARLPGHARLIGEALLAIKARD